MSQNPNDSYVFGGDIRARLRAAEEALDEGTQRLIQQLGVGTGARCLEVGAGGGSIAEWLSDLVGPTGHVVATDTDIRFLDALPKRSNLEVRQHDVLADPLEAGAFDFVHARLVLEHLPDPDAAIRNLREALRPGGLMLIEDGDHIAVSSVSEHGAAEFTKMQSVRLAEFDKAGVNHAFARTLPARLRAQGLVDVDNEGRIKVAPGGSALARWGALSIDHLRPRLVGPDKLTDAELDRVIELFDDPNFESFTIILLGAWGRRAA